MIEDVHNLLSVHAIDTALSGTNTVRPYRRGWLASVNKALTGDPSVPGQFYAMKLRDEAKLWRKKQLMPIPDTLELQIDEAAELEATVMVQAIFHTSGNPGSGLNAGDVSAVQRIAARLVKRFPKVGVWGFGNEREFSWNGEDEDYFSLEGAFGEVIQDAGKGFAAGHDASAANWLRDLEQRVAVWESYGCVPDHFSLHMYDQTGHIARHLDDIPQAHARILGRTRDWTRIQKQYVIGECAAGFNNYSTRPELSDRRGGRYAAAMGTKGAEVGIPVCHFTFDRLDRKATAALAGSPRPLSLIGEYLRRAAAGDLEDPDPPTPDPDGAGTATAIYLQQGASAKGLRLAEAEGFRVRDDHRRRGKGIWT